jgi:hypothetical protein
MKRRSRRAKGQATTAARDGSKVQRGRDPARRGCVDADHTDHVEATPLVADELASNPTRQESVPNHRVAAETRTNQSVDWAEPRASVQEQEPSLQYAAPGQLFGTGHLADAGAGPYVGLMTSSTAPGRKAPPRFRVF